MLFDMERDKMKFTERKTILFGLIITNNKGNKDESIRHVRTRQD